MNERDKLHAALVWCLRHGVKAIDWNETGYWQQAGYDGADIMPPAELHLALDRAREEILRKPGSVHNQ